MGIVGCEIHMTTNRLRSNREKVIKPVKKPISEEKRMLKAGIPLPPPLFSSSHVIESESYRREKEREREREREEKERIEKEKELEKEREKQRELEREREKEREREREREREKEKEKEWERERARMDDHDALARVSASSGRPSKPKSSKTSKQLLSNTLPFTSVPSSCPIPSPSSVPNTTKLKKSSSKKEKSVKKSEKSSSPSTLPSSIPTASAVGSSSDGSALALSSEQITSGVVFDAMGNKIWICPSCKGPDDGRPMIGCDDCDAWYHWVCVNIQVPPDENENWYCRFCIVKKSESSERKKKKKSRKKPKVPVS